MRKISLKCLFMEIRSQSGGGAELCGAIERLTFAQTPLLSICLFKFIYMNISN